VDTRLKGFIARAAHAARLDVLVTRTLARRGAAILLYHDPTPDVLAEHLAYLCRRHSPIPLDVLVQALESDDWSEVPPTAVVITIDDGLRGNAALADVFRAYGVTPTIYLCSALVGTSRRFWFQLPGLDPEPLKLLPDDERLAALAASHGFAPHAEVGPDAREALSRAEIDAMSDAVSFGSHTRTHPILPRCDAATAEREIAESKHELERLLGRPCEHFAFPNGDYGERELELVRAAGYRSARTTDVGWNTRGADPFRLRVLTRGAEDLSVPLLALHLAGIGVVKRELTRARARPIRLRRRNAPA
jgi:peptidoglycan/xylan/chitin deacetylase (PgdA/CDA1 family)